MLTYTYKYDFTPNVFSFQKMAKKHMDHMMEDDEEDEHDDDDDDDSEDDDEDEWLCPWEEMERNHKYGNCSCEVDGEDGGDGGDGGDSQEATEKTPGNPANTRR